MRSRFPSALDRPSRSRGRQLILFQATICALAASVAIFAPPASGEILLLPFTPAGAERLPRLATSGGLALVARGPIAGSLVVRGAGQRIAGHMIAMGVLPVAAAATGCGSAA